MAMSLGTVLANIYQSTIIPQPNSVESPEQQQNLSLPKQLSISADPQLANEKAVLVEALARLGIKVQDKAEFGIKLALDKNLPEEGYTLQIKPDKQILISGGSAGGVFYAVQSFKQFLPPAVWSREALKAAVAYQPVSVPCVNIKDAPMTPWRGLMLDSARHFMPKEFMFKLIDSMAMHKLNRLHWHIVDSEGWRMEIKKYPKLHMATQAFPAEYPSEDPTDVSRPAKYMYGHFHGGGFYTQEDIKQIVAYAKQRHIEIVPEIGFPAHAMAALTAYPEFSTTKKAPTVRSNISPDLYGVREESLQFLKDILDETMELFPYKVIHFGGDEAPKGQWKNCPDAQALMKKHGLQNEDQIQAWMFNELAAHIAKKGRVAAGWEEIMHGTNMQTLTKSAIVYPWLSHDNAVKSANAGHPVVHCAVGPFYLDSWQTSHPSDNWSLYKGPFTLSSIYNFKMFPGNLSEQGKNNILGAQGQMWSELTPKPEHVEYQIYPRLCALAELTWTRDENKNYDNFYTRLLGHAKRMDAMGLNYRYIDPAPLAAWNPQALENKQLEIDIEIPALQARAKDLNIELAYLKGAEGLQLKQVALQVDGKVIASQELEQLLGTHTPKASFKFSLDKLAANSKPLKAKLLVSHANGSARDSYGQVVVFADKKSDALFDYSKYKGGDYPNATWNFGDGAQQVRIPMDGVVKEPGQYELIAKLTANSEPVSIDSLSFSGTSGVTGSMQLKLKLDEQNQLAYLPLEIAEKHLRAGSSVLVDVKKSSAQSKGATKGELRLRRVMQTAMQNGSCKWNPEMLGKGNMVVYAKGVTAAKDGSINASFDYTDGSCGCEIKVVELLDADGKLLVASKQQGFAGRNPKNNKFELSSPAIKQGQSYTLRCMLAGGGGSDSHGIIKAE